MFFFVQCLFGQSSKLDSLTIALTKAKHDTVKCHILNDIISQNNNPDFWVKYNNLLKDISDKGSKSSKNSIEKNSFLKFYSIAISNQSMLAEEQGDIELSEKLREQSLKISMDINDKEGEANSYNHIAILSEHQGNVEKAFDYYLKSIKIREEIKEKKGLGQSYHNIAGLYEGQGDIPKALEYYHKALKIQEEINDKEGIALTMNSMGYTYLNQDNSEKALEYYTKGLNIYKELDDISGIAFSLSNIGHLYLSSGKVDEALPYFIQSLDLCKEIDYQEGIASCLNAIGTINFRKENYHEALKFNQQALTIFQNIDLQYGVANLLKDIGAIYFKLSNESEAIKYAQQSLQVSKNIGYPLNIKNVASLLKSIYQKQKKYKEAFEMYNLEIQMRDSITNEDNKKASIKKQFQYEYEVKRTADSLKVAKDKELNEVRFKQERTQRYALFGGLILVLIFSVFIVNRYRITVKQKQIIELKEREAQKQNVIIAQQKHLVEEKHKEITDSINYAERIQRSFLATRDFLNSFLDEYFVFFKPKDIVSGDFYWATKTISPDGNENFILVTADSTGHGVPGAIMSLLNTSSLDKSVELGIFEPAEILNHTRKTIIERLKKDGSDEGGKDGMDCSLICLNKNKSILKYSAANNPIWIIRNTKSEVNTDNSSNIDFKELIELKPDKMPVGKHDKDKIPFTQHEIELQKGDVIYTLTDGFPDQFGGPNGKKYMYKKLKETLLLISHYPMTEQYSFLSKELEDWKCNTEQVDDITIIGIRI